MTEQLLQFIWRYQYFNNADLRTSAGEALEIISAGQHNSNQGPDFLNAKIRCGGTTLAGNIEIHVHASEWQEHKHSEDSNYANVILHVVLSEDKELQLNFPVLELSDRIPKLLLTKYQQLINAQYFVACEAHIRKVNELVFFAWKERLFIERLQEKTAYIQTVLQKNNYHWEEVFWQMLARNFGMKVNVDAFEAMATTIPVTMIAKHKPQLLQLEALLMGQCGLLEKDFDDDYPVMLQKEYRFLKKKYSLPEVHIPVHFLRMRPANFPTLRLSQLAALIHASDHLFSRIRDGDELKIIEKMFDVAANDYWHYHYSFDEASAFKKKTLGDQMIRNIILNTVLPMLYGYGWYNNLPGYQAKALHWAAHLKAEKNNITEGFVKLGIPNNSAADSQSLIQLKNKYCNEKRCLECAIGNAILKGNS